MSLTLIKDEVRETPDDGRSPAVSAVQVAPARFVTIELAAVVTGLSPGAIRTKIARAVWVEGREYVRREGRVFIDLRGYERWVAQGAA